MAVLDCVGFGLVLVGYLPTHWLAHADEYYFSAVEEIYTRPTLVLA